MGLNVSVYAMATAGMRYATMSTQYCATCVHVTPFMPPSVAYSATMAMPITTPSVITSTPMPCASGSRNGPRKRLNTTPTPRICPAT